MSAILARGEKDRVAHARRDDPKLWLFLARNHGELTAADGLMSKAMQYEIGNPLGCAIFEYDRTSLLFGQFDDERVTQVGRKLDAELETILQSASGG